MEEALSLHHRICYKGMDLRKKCASGECESCASFGPERRIAERRKKRTLFMLLERREGFDRRRNFPNQRFPFGFFESAAFRLRENQRVLAMLLAVFILFNFADYAFTLRALSVGHAEGNPIMKELLDLGPFAAGSVKAGVSLFVVVAVWRLKRNKLVLQVAIISLALYSVLMGYHVMGILLYG